MVTNSKQRGQVSPSSIVRRYAGAVLTVVWAVWLLQTIPPLAAGGAVLFLLPAVAVSAWFGGGGPAMVASILAMSAAVSMFPPPTEPPPFDLVLWMQLAGFVLTAAVLAAIGQQRRFHLQRMARAAAEWQQKQEDMSFQISHLRLAKDVAQRAEAEATSERDVLRQQVQLTSERLTIAEEATGLVLFDWDLHTGSMYVGGNLLRIFGVSTQAWQGWESWQRRLHLEDRKKVEDQLAAARTTGKPLELEFRVLWPDDSLHWVITRATTLKDQQGRPRRMIGIFQEITRAKRAEQEMIRNEKLAAAGRLASSFAHEINNPLAAVTNLLYILQRDPSLSAAGRGYLSLASEELERAANLARQTLAFYSERTEPVRVNLPELLDEVLEPYVRRAPASVRIEKEYGPLVEIYGLKGEIRQALLNLVSNALQAVGESGLLRVETRPSRRPGQSGVLVNVHDNGPGIPDEHLPRLFEPFFSTKKELGAGLGLWMTREIIQRHGGSIEVRTNTDHDSHGSCFSVFLPMGTRPKPAAREDASVA